MEEVQFSIQPTKAQKTSFWKRPITLISASVLILFTVFFASNPNLFQGRIPALDGGESTFKYEIEDAVYVADTRTDKGFINRGRDKIDILGQVRSADRNIEYRFRTDEDANTAADLDMRLDPIGGTLHYRGTKAASSKAITSWENEAAFTLDDLEFNSGEFKISAYDKSSNQRLASSQSIKITLLHPIKSNGPIEYLYSGQEFGNIYNVNLNDDFIGQDTITVSDGWRDKFTSPDSVTPQLQGGYGPSTRSIFNTGYGAEWVQLLPAGDALYPAVASDHIADLKIDTGELSKDLAGMSQDYIALYMANGTGYRSNSSSPFTEVLGMSILRLNFQDIASYARIAVTSPSRTLDPNYDLVFDVNNYINTKISNTNMQYHDFVLKHFLYTNSNDKTLITNYGSVYGSGEDSNHFEIDDILLREGINAFELSQKDIYGNTIKSSRHIAHKAPSDAIDIISIRTDDDINKSHYLVEVSPFFSGSDLDIKLRVNNLEEVAMQPVEGEGVIYKSQATLRPGANLVTATYYENGAIVATRTQSVLYELPEISEEEAENDLVQFVRLCTTDRAAAEEALSNVAYQLQESDDVAGNFFLALIVGGAIIECNNSLPADEHYDAKVIGITAAVKAIGLHCTETERNRLETSIGSLTESQMSFTEKVALLAELDEGFARCDDVDEDGVLNANDNCPDISNPGQEDMDLDGTGDTCDDDIDGDNHPNATDNCRAISNPDQADLDDNGFGDVCDLDDDGDSVDDIGDNCPRIVNTDQINLDGDEFGAACDDDDTPDTSIIDAQEATTEAVLEISDVLDSTETDADFDSATAEIDEARVLVDALPEGDDKDDLNATLDELEAKMLEFEKVIDDLAELEVIAAAATTDAEKAAVLVLIEELYVDATSLPDGDLSTALEEKIAELIEALSGNVPDPPETDDTIKLTVQSDPLQVLVETTKPSSRTILNLYKYSDISLTDPTAVYTVDHEINTSLLPDSYLCATGTGCPNWSGVARGKILEPGIYFYRVQVQFDDGKFSLDSDTFSLTQTVRVGPDTGVQPQPPVTPPPFTGYIDVPQTAPEYPAIKYVYDIGIMRGSFDTQNNRVFKPNDTLTRTEAFAVVNRIAGLSQGCQPYNPQLDGDLGFADLRSVMFDPAAAWYLQEIKCSRQLGSGIIQGYSDGTVRALNKIAWGESAKVVLEAGRFGQVLAANLPFADTTVNPWWRDYYVFLNENRIVVPDGQELITRGQLAQLIYALGRRGLLNEQLLSSRLVGS